ncbi:hypothetical protein MWG03_02045 [Fusobacterium necrophorum]|uniref:hypothetical protein n=1 Tax=Fusobacterium necrophorum TaxID=859 RepID=UPI00254B3C42|nr:hypothetical protein [Fusobacterium necrophorum]MDK4501111.1 hypothetical protein [Fusobacterium necrophorum]
MEHKLVIAEKPSVAVSIVKIIGANNKKDDYYKGNGPYQIAKILAEEKIERPSYYLAQSGMGNHNPTITVQSRTFGEEQQEATF